MDSNKKSRRPNIRTIIMPQEMWDFLSDEAHRLRMTGISALLRKIVSNYEKNLKKEKKDD